MRYAFWSLGHCYSPEMDYKRQLGHRIYPREAFRQLLRQHRGPFEWPATGGPQATPRADVDVIGTGSTADFEALRTGESCSAAALLPS